jgi:hypothetical protein
MAVKDFISFKRFRLNKIGLAVRSLCDKFLHDLNNIKIIGNDIVLPDEVCRPDKLALKWYHNSRYDWVIMKYNGISNPFSINEGLRYKVPNLQDFLNKTQVISTPDVISNNTTTNKTKGTKRLYEVDVNKENYNKKKNPTDKIIPSTGITLKNGALYFNDNDKFRNTGSIEGIEGIEGKQNTINEIGISNNITNNNIGNMKEHKCNAKASDVLIYKLLSENQDITQQDLTKIIIDKEKVIQQRPKINPNVFSKK